MKFQDVYPASICKDGILGGLLYVKESELLFCTNKLTVPEEIRRLHMPFGEILEVRKDRFHTVTVSMKNGTSYRFLVFTREKFLRHYFLCTSDAS